ncbi:MAG TPA: cupin domain-containing protein [Xanthomonadales bacterium]|nr:cupin domain-containing protein [Xanthomonadales bacterium]
MQSKRLRFGKGFRVAFGNRRAQAAEMTIAQGGAEGGVHNRHAGADQWLFVVAGQGTAIVGGTRVKLKAGTLLLIEKGERHEIRNDGAELLRTLNVYVPPAYRADGEELLAGKPRRK